MKRGVLIANKLVNRANRELETANKEKSVDGANKLMNRANKVPVTANNGRSAIKIENLQIK
ncbi:hypothetical protein [Bacillus sp. AFS017336]|uniref:hypothetical protein n=1 Tax=Bacillus sp. AFS017336 TaxID=2033489 RepID=UPI0015CF7510|nr:hypothetical protein [Bacillus sp. AFS017336]